MGSQLLSYKQYKILNETLGSPITLGMAKPTNLGMIGNRLTPEELAAIELEEGKKKKKKMDDGEAVEIDADTGDGEVVDDKKAPPKDKPCDCGSDDCPDCGGDSDIKEEGCGKKHSKKKMSDCGGGDDEEIDISDDSEDVDIDDDDDDDDSEDVEDLEGGELAMMKKKMKKGMKKNAKKGMQKEEAEWWTSVHNMLDGFSSVTEESLLAPYDPNEGLTSSEPGPGEVGYAPSGRVGS